MRIYVPHLHDLDFPKCDLNDSTVISRTGYTYLRFFPRQSVVSINIKYISRVYTKRQTNARMPVYRLLAD